MSFVIRHDGRYLHHNLVVAMLNDLFGIQSRGGCSCAGPYGHRLLGIDIETSHEFEREISRGCEGIKPGWIRVNFNYFISETVFEFILGAVELIASDGWRLIPQYAFEPATGLWRHAGDGGRGAAVARRHPLRRGPDDVRGPPPPGARIAARRLPGRGAQARHSPPPPLAAAVEGSASLAVGPDFESLRWFWLPHEVAAQVASA